MFISFDYNNYEDDTIGNRMMYIQKTSGNPYAVLPRYTDKQETHNSLYGREIQKEVNALTKYIQDIEREIKDTKKRVEFYSGKNETEMRSIVQRFFDMKMNAIKARASLIREIDKSRKEDLKLHKDLTGSAPAGGANLLPNDHMSDTTLMSNLFSGGVDNFFLSTQYNTPKTNDIPVSAINNPPTPVSTPSPTNVAQKEHL